MAGGNIWLSLRRGLCYGAAQGYCRALFTELIPRGHEADMFALFAITDKGSSWLGPLVASIIVQQTGSVRPVLIYLLLAMVVPAVLLRFLDLSGSIKNARGVDGSVNTLGDGAGKDSNLPC